MARKIRSTRRNSIVIVCEGTDTEVKYLTDLAAYVNSNFPDRFTDIRIVPTAQELVVATQRAKNRKQLKNCNPYAYYVQEEDNALDYDNYRAQPTRYVREAELFLKDGTYGEAWAVYDHDNFPEHEDASTHAKTVGVNIAYSSISFEEWILIHFERNKYAFSKSVCKRHKKDISCGSNVHPDDCHGRICVAGRIREQKFIPEYGKSMDGLFKTLFPNHKLAIINAAWLRSLHQNENLWMCNPITTVDRLISRLMDYSVEYSWIASDCSFDLDRFKLKLHDGQVENIGDCTMAFDYKIYDEIMNPIIQANTGAINPGGTCRLTVPTKGRYIGFIGHRDIKVTAL